METLNLIWNFIYNYLGLIFLIIYIIIAIYYQDKYYKERRKNLNLESAIFWQKLLNKINKQVIEEFEKQEKFLKKQIEKKEKIIKEIREARNISYNKHFAKIIYYRKRVLAYKLAIKNTFKFFPEFSDLLQLEYTEFSKKKMSELINFEKEFDKKEK